MNDNHILNQLQEYIDGELPPSEERKFKEHIAVCPRCAEETIGMETLLRQFSSLRGDTPLPDGFLETADATLRQTMAHSRRNGAHPKPNTPKVISLFSTITWYYAAAAMLLLAGISVFVIVTMNRQPAPVTVASVTPRQEQHPIQPNNDTASRLKVQPAAPQVKKQLGNNFHATHPRPEIAANAGQNNVALPKDTVPSFSTTVQENSASKLQTEPVQSVNTIPQKTSANAKIIGRVVDDKGTPLPGVVVQVLTTGRGAVTDIDGRYTIIGVPEGIYTVEAKLIGYVPQRVDSVSIMGELFSQDYRLTPSTVAQKEIVVTGEQNLVNSMNTSSQKSVVGNEASPPLFVPTEKDIRSGRTNGIGYRRSPASGSVSSGANISIQDNDGNRNYYRHRPPTDQLRYYYPPVDYNTEEYKKYAENGFMDVAGDPLSTFSIDVDAASYTNVRRFLNNGQRPPADAVKIEEMINYFTYNYPQPRAGRPFSITTEAAFQCPWDHDHMLLLVGLQGKNIDARDLPPNNLVFLIDVSGSMRDANKLPLVKSAFRMLVNQLRPQDRVSIVTYAGAARITLPSTSGRDKDRILDAIDRLQAGGSTAGGEGIQLAYQIAKENFADEGNNRVILATDGDFNVGVSSEEGLEQLIEEHRNEKIFLTTLGFGMGNYKNNKMQILADKGNGNNYYIDNLQEAERVFIGQMAGTLFTIAKDVKVQIEFNPDNVKAYRLIGYEKRLLNKEDFNDDTKDAGELGAGHSVTALYEIVPVGGSVDYPNVDPLKYQKNPPAPHEGKYSDELLTVKMRYKDPDGDESKLMTQVYKVGDIRNLNRTSENLRFAASVAEFGMILGNARYRGSATLKDARELAESAKGSDPEGYRSEFIRLIELARNLYNENQWR